MSYVLDSNVVIYAFDKADPAKHAVARRLLYHATSQGGTSIRQVLGEVLNAAHKKRRLSLPAARRAVDLLEATTTVLPAERHATLAASEMAERYLLQYFDSLICVVARQAGASILFSEDMQDGLRMGALTIVNPFKDSNAELLVELLDI